ncbi:hypothetical protein CR513_55168, partial [Mucuna pruriens]
MDIPRSLHAAEGMTNSLNTPPKITQFLELCRGLYDGLKIMFSPQRGTLVIDQKAKLSAYATLSKSKAMDNKIEALEQ